MNFDELAALMLTAVIIINLSAVAVWATASWIRFVYKTIKNPLQ